MRFFPLAYLEAEVEQPGNLTARVALKNFVILNRRLIPDDVRSRAKQWSDYIDYWAVDWDFQDDTFVQGWAAYRTRREKSCRSSPARTRTKRRAGAAFSYA